MGTHQGRYMGGGGGGGGGMVMRKSWEIAKISGGSKQSPSWNITNLNTICFEMAARVEPEPGVVL